MTKIRRFVAIAALAATLTGLAVPGIGANLLANPVAHQHISSPVSASQSARLVALKIYGPCPLGGENDC